jgi:F-type H+-transporting ATPase subunit c
MTKLRYLLFALVGILITAAPVLAQETAGGGGATGGQAPLINITGALAVGIAAAGGALGDGRAIAGACEGTARNPGAGGRIFTMMLLGCVLIETLVLFTFLLAFLGK